MNVHNLIRKTYIIAEAGVNHNGSIELAKKLIDVAADSGADAVKFQTFKAEKIVSKNAPKADYQTLTTDKNESQFNMIKKLELDQKSHQILIDYSAEKGIQFLSTPFDLESIDLLSNYFSLPRLKVPSGEITNGPLLLQMARTRKPIILSTGMSTLGEIEEALSILAFGYLNQKDNPTLMTLQEAFISTKGQQLLRNNVVLLHCTTEYPTPLSDVNLQVIETLRKTFGLAVGYSDHTLGITVPIAAVAKGAVLIEKHFTLDRNLPGPDHKASLEPNELKEMVNGIRQVEQAIGSGIKYPTISELKTKTIVRKSIVASKSIKKGEAFTEKNLTFKRPGNGLSPNYYWELLGKLADKDYEEEELVRL